MSANVLIYGSSILRKQSEEITKSEDISKLTTMLFKTLDKEGGIGLAAPQIGLLKRVFIMDTTSLESENNFEDRFKRVVINPRIVNTSAKTNYYREGCLSFPNLFEDVVRPETIWVQYLNDEFKSIERQLNGIEARIFQHEFDHLNGVLFIDRLSQIRRALIANKLKRLQRYYR